MSLLPLGCVYVTMSGKWCGVEAERGVCEAHAAVRCRCGDQALRSCPDCGEAMCFPCWRIRKKHRCAEPSRASTRKERLKDGYRAWANRSPAR